MKKFKKSTALPIALCVYVTVMAAYFLPRNHELDLMEKWGMVVVSYLIVGLLWLILKKKERMMKK